jgi:hypothetical protein|tara:strand:+ start:259 stop:546 length:288 start_codon:yes stop_codon:yes gene_type:complete
MIRDQSDHRNAEIISKLRLMCRCWLIACSLGTLTSFEAIVRFAIRRSIAPPPKKLTRFVEPIFNLAREKYDLPTHAVRYDMFRNAGNEVSAVAWH